MNHSVPNTLANIASGIASIAPASLVWLAWHASARRLCSTRSVTSTA